MCNFRSNCLRFVLFDQKTIYFYQENGICGHRLYLGYYLPSPNRLRRRQRGAYYYTFIILQDQREGPKSIYYT